MAGRYGNGALTWRVLELYNEQTRQVARESAVPLIDLARLMPKNSAYFYDQIHFNGAGADMVAEILFQELCPWLIATYPERATGRCPAS